MYKKCILKSLQFTNIDISRSQFFLVGTDLAKHKHMNGHQNLKCKPKSKFSTQRTENTHAVTINSENFCFSFLSILRVDSTSNFPNELSKNIIFILFQEYLHFYHVKGYFYEFNET